MSEAKGNNGAQVHELTGTGTVSPGIVSPRGTISVSHGLPFQVINVCGFETVINHTGQACKRCRNLHTKNTMVWSGACGKATTVRHCLSMSPCEGPVRRDL